LTLIAKTRRVVGQPDLATLRQRLPRLRVIPTTPQSDTLQISDIGRNSATLDTTKATLISATSETNTGVRGGVVTIASADWAWADCRTVAFPGTPDNSRVCLKNG
jgi:hypothetical protein